MAKKFYGELSYEDAQKFDKLILKLQALNGGPVPERKMVKKIIPLPPKENAELWEYMLHIIELIIVSPKFYKVLKTVAAIDPYNTKDDLLEEWKMAIAPYVYRYMWRKYHHSEKCEYVFTTARFGLLDYLSKHSWIEKMPITDQADFDLILSNQDGHKKVNNVNIKD